MEKVIVVGAGILGASTAFYLAKKGVSVTLVDRRDVGEATYAAAGIVCPWLTNRQNKKWYQLVTNGANSYPKLLKELEELGETQTGYAKVGAINIYDTEQKIDRKMEMAKQRQKETPEMGEVTKLTSVKTRQLFPPLSEEYGAIQISGAARVNGAALRDALIRATRKLNGRIIVGDASLLVEQSEVNGVEIDGEKYVADKVIVTGGVWANHILKPLGIDFPVSSQKAQIMHLHLSNVNTSNWPVVMGPYNFYLLPFEQGKIVVGATQENNQGLDHRVTLEGIHSILRKTMEIAPGLSNSTYVETRVGFRPFTKDHLPVFGNVPNWKRLYIANGLGASGLTSGPYIGSQLASLITGEFTELNIEDYHIQNNIL
ncbi:NAD(P)/FAD-dependent oxidoreductase [Aquibacillus kalidii]|uniref:NAD(P)/FAD-dependent oxidoreductase n=1 Tax=Aquibacillus kalidii TaxID=2762597 RepID=UPI001646BB9A|nr:FAD-binding oxidoreductase [Aquibacillus kalidii]